MNLPLDEPGRDGGAGVGCILLFVVGVIAGLVCLAYGLGLIGR